MTAKKRIESKMDANAVGIESTALLGLVADIRAAVGDPEGKLMQDELVEHCRKLAHSADWNRRRVEMLSRLQKHMRDPERTLVCDILANGQLLPDPNGKRYGFVATGKEHHCMPNTQLRDRALVTDMENRNDRIESDGSSPVPCSALAGSFDIEAIELAFFNHDGEGAEPAPGQWEERRDQWRSFKAYLAAHPRQEVSGCDAYREDLPPAKNP